MPNYNVAIECQGVQHFKSIDFFGGEKHFNYIKKLDENKLKLCNEHNIKILYYTKYENTPYKTINNDNELLETIYKYG